MKHVRILLATLLAFVGATQMVLANTSWHIEYYGTDKTYHKVPMVYDEGSGSYTIEVEMVMGWGFWFLDTNDVYYGNTRNVSEKISSSNATDIPLDIQANGGRDMELSADGTFTFTLRETADGIFLTITGWPVEPYAVLDGSTLTFYYDELKDTRPGTKYEIPWTGETPGWTDMNTFNTTVTEAVFDASFDGYHGLTNASYMFYKMQNLTTIVDLQYLHTENVKTMSNMFSSSNKLRTFDVSGLDTHNVTNMSQMFAGCPATSIDVSNFNTENVTNMYHMFRYCSSIQRINLSKFNTEKVVNMNGMFSYCASLLFLELMYFSTKNVTDMESMFDGCTNLGVIACNDDWRKDNMKSANMFRGCKKLKGGNGTAYDENIVDASYAHPDSGTKNPGYFEGVANYYIYICGIQVTKDNAEDLSVIDGVTGSVVYDPYNKTLTLSDATIVVDHTSSTNHAPHGIYSYVKPLTIILNGHNTIRVTLEGSYYPLYSTNDMTVKGNGTLTLEKTTNLGGIIGFNDGANLTLQDCSVNIKSSASNTWIWGIRASNDGSITLDHANLDITDVQYPLEGLTNVVLKNGTTLVEPKGAVWDSTNHYYTVDGQRITGHLKFEVTPEPYAVVSEDGKTLTFYYDMLKKTRTGTKYDMKFDFYPEWANSDTANPSIITTARFDSSFADYHELIMTSHMFYNMRALTQIIGFENLHTEKVYNMYGMFEGCSSLTSLDLSHFNTTHVTNMSYMFNECSSLTSLDVSNFNTANVLSINHMFHCCYKLETIYCNEDWGKGCVTNSENMFLYCPLLVGGKGTTYDENNVGISYAHPDGGTTNPGYFTMNILPGDVNQDGYIDIADVTKLVNKLLNNEPVDELSDIDDNGELNSSDAKALVNNVLGNTNMWWTLTAKGNISSNNWMTFSNTDLNINSDKKTCYHSFNVKVADLAGFYAILQVNNGQTFTVKFNGADVTSKFTLAPGSTNMYQISIWDPEGIAQFAKNGAWVVEFE
ncbi:MAG: BspA family leucine-rich repeat surface protein [Prevotella sp.]|nr:BspA family leucine-rich repeat surface protein [Prevotella sp.]MBR0269364.1 BspA family leucine-rich repeat surface protein [Prevotella sp.]